jgi:hypothetical protein
VVLSRITRIERRLPQVKPETINDVPKVPEDFLLPENRPADIEFRGTLKTGETIVCVPLKTLYREETPGLILNYSCLSDALHVQKFFGVFQDATRKYAVMEDLKNQEHIIALQDVFGNARFVSSTFQRKLRLL